MSLSYRINLKPDNNGTLLVTCPALPEVTTFGENESDALKRARHAIEEALAARISGGQDIPGGNVRGRHLVWLPASAACKVELYQRRRRKLRPLKGKS
jgi:antitoxin HicB